METIVKKQPRLRNGAPAWWNHHGSQMRVEKLDVGERLLVIGGGTATVQISPDTGGRNDSWSLDWEITHSAEREARANGHTLFSSEELEEAFGLRDQPGEELDDEFVEEYGGACARRGLYLRWENFLNIPCPGTGRDGDPNVSISVSRAIRVAVRTLLATHARV